MKDALEIDQEDFFGRLLADEFFSDVAILLQRKGVTENDIQRALKTLNDRGSGKIGLCLVVLMPALTPDGGAGPRYKIAMTVQVIETPLFNLGDGGTGISAEQAAQRVRMICHYFGNGFGGTYAFDGMDPIAVADGDISYGVKFTRLAGDAAPIKVATPKITAAGSTITITTATAGADIYYTTDGTGYPSAANTAAATLYTAPFTQATPATIRAAASKTGLQQSDIAQVTIS